MVKIIDISDREIIQHLKLSCQIPGVSEAIAARKIIFNAAAEAGFTVEVEELQQAADNLRLANNLLQADSTMEWLEKHCLSLDEFEEIAHTNLLSTKLAQHLFGDRVELFFAEHQLEYMGAIVYEVILDDEDLAMELFYELQEHEISFHEIAQQYSQELELRRKGGYRGVVSRTELRPELSAAIFAAQPPQVLKPIVTPQGVHLIQVEEILQPQLDDSLRVKILSDLFSDWLQQEVAQLNLVIHLEPVGLESSAEQQVLVVNQAKSS